MSMTDLPDQFLYSRKGPWPQPSPSHPMICADEVLNIPPMEELLFNETIGARYLKARLGYPVQASAYSASVEDWKGVTPQRFNEIMTQTLFTRFRVPLTASDLNEMVAAFAGDAHIQKELQEGELYKYDFTAMNLIDPIEGTHCAATKAYFQIKDGQHSCLAIWTRGKDQDEKGTHVWRTDSSFGISSVYALQGAAYHVLFVVHPALHFPMDSVNAITKTSLPMGHPLFQLFLPHSSYSLALDNAVLESAESVVNNNAQGTRFDPLTGNAYNLKLLFGAGYSGLGPKNGVEYDPVAYPVYNYMNPTMYNDRNPHFDSFYGKWLAAYYEKAFLPLCQAVAHHIVADETMMEYTVNWARYCHTHVLGFPSPDMIKDPAVLAEVMAIYIWNDSVSHGGDHWSFANQVTAVEKCLRIRRKPPVNRSEPAVNNADPNPGMRIFSPNDMQRASLCQYMFFQAWAIEPNLNQTYYAFTDRKLLGAVQVFHATMDKINEKFCQIVPASDDPFGPTARTTCQPLKPVPNPDYLVKGKDSMKEEILVPYARTIPSSIQY